MRKMRLLFVLTRYPGIGGIESVTRTVVKELLAGGYEIELCSFLQEGDYDLPCKLYCMPEKEYDTAENRTFLVELIKEGSYDAVVYQDSYAPSEQCVIYAAKKNKVPVLTFEHNTPLRVLFKRNLSSWYTPMGLARNMAHPYLVYKERKRKRFLLTNSFRYVLLAESFIDDFCKLLKEKSCDNRLRVVHNPIIPCEQPALTDKKDVILCVAQLNSVKRVNLMINAWNRICESLPGWEFWIVGDGEERSRLEKMVSKLGVKRVVFHGFQKSAPFYEQAKIFWMTSKFEGWGMTLVEAMQRLCVPIAMDTYSSLHDIIDDGTNGRICKPDDIESFYKATLSLTNDDKLREKMAVNAREKTHKWEITNVMMEWKSLLKELEVKREDEK